MKRRRKIKKNPKDKHYLNDAISRCERACPDETAIIVITRPFNTTGEAPTQYGANFNDRKAAIEILKNLLFRWGVNDEWMRHTGDDESQTPDPAWRPIETAHKDGRVVDLWVRSLEVEGRAAGCHFHEGGWYADIAPLVSLQDHCNDDDVEVLYWRPVPNGPPK